MFSWFRRLPSKPAAQQRRRPAVEALEDRTVPISTVTTLGAGVTPQELVQKIVGPGVAVSNIKYTGETQAAGIFSGGTASVGLDSGVVLSTGRAVQVRGPNTTGNLTTVWTTPGDNDLSALAGQPTFDAAVLEFDAVLPRGSLSLSYVFSSDEYLEYVNLINDIFAIYIDGTRANRLPGGNTPVSINTVNHLVNTQFFINNTGRIRNTSMDGLTTVISNVFAVQPGVKHHIKIAIADAADRILDSNVFIGTLGSPNVRTFNPLRFTYNAITKTYDGQLTFINYDKAPLVGPFFVTLSLPSGITLANPSGRLPNGRLFLRLPNTLLPNSPVRLLVKLHDPQHVPLGSYFLNNGNVQYSNTLL